MFFNKQIFSDVFVAKFILVMMFLVKMMYYKWWKKSDEYKDQYDVMGSIIEVLLINMQLFMILPFFPSIGLFAPFILLVFFKFEVFKIKMLTNKPQILSLRDVSY